MDERLNRMNSGLIEHGWRMNGGLENDWRMTRG
jgi:hypothetical protein